MPKPIQTHIDELNTMRHYPKELYYLGNLELLKQKKVSIVGTRRPNQYTKLMTSQLAHQLSSNGVCIVSGGAMGVDALAHKAALHRTIMVSPSGLHLRYPQVNKQLIAQLEVESLVLSSYAHDYKATPYSFVQRNEIVVALGEALIVTQCDLNSGSMRSVEFALKMGKPIYVLPHRINESQGTQSLLQQGLAKAIYSVDDFIHTFANKNRTAPNNEDAFVKFCQKNPTYEEAISQFQEEVFEAELNGTIKIINGHVQLL